MDKKVFQRHAELCHVFANPVRLEIIDSLRQGERCVKELAELTGLNQVKISQHLSLMRNQGVVVTHREGTNIYYRVANPKIIRAYDLIHEVLIEQATEHAKLLGAQVSFTELQ